MPVTSLIHVRSNMPVTCIMMHSNVTGPFEQARFAAVAGLLHDRYVPVNQNFENSKTDGK